MKDFTEIGETSFFKHELNSDDFWKCYIKNIIFTPYHFTGTYAMSSVVDGELRVIGTENLREMDASTIPVGPRDGPNAAVIAIAEKERTL